jgi:hypothetical protein
MGKEILWRRASNQAGSKQMGKSVSGSQLLAFYFQDSCSNIDLSDVK